MYYSDRTFVRLTGLIIGYEGEKRKRTMECEGGHDLCWGIIYVQQLLFGGGYMDQAWTFRRGSWATITSPIAFVDDNGDQLLQLEGYSEDTLWLGLEGGFQVEVYTRMKDDHKAPMPYLVIVYLGGENRDYVFAEDLPSLLQLLNSVAPIIQCSTEDIEAEEDEDDFGGNGSGDE